MQNKTKKYKAEEYLTGPLNLLLMEKVTIEKVLKKTKGNRTKASIILGISDKTLRDKILKHQITYELIND